MNPEHEWCKDFDNVLALARWLDADGDFPDTETVIYFFSKPWKWTREYKAMKAGFANLTAAEEAQEQADVMNQEALNQ